MHSATSALSASEVEKRNLVQILKHVLRDVVDLSLCTGTTTVENQHELLTQLFVVLDHIMLHGLRARRKASSVFSFEQPSAWPMLGELSKFSNEAKIVTRSVSEMPDIRTNLGRQRAWLRLALIEKRLSEYLRIAVENRENFLADYYDPDALMMDEESGVLVTGLLVSLNVLDCNLCLKGIAFDSSLAPIYYAPFLREDSDDARGALLRISLADTKSSDQESAIASPNGYATTLNDQKAYLEELNKHLTSQVTSLQSKLAQSEEDLKRTKQELQTRIEADEAEAARVRTIDQLYASAECRKAELEDELRKNVTQNEGSAKELESRDNSIRKLEKDVAEKNELIELLRRQLDELKQMNIDLFAKAQTLERNVDSAKRDRAKLEERAEKLKNDNKELEKRVQSQESDSSRAEKLAQLISAKEARCTALESDLRIEKEWRDALTKQLAESRAAADAMQLELTTTRQKAARLVEVEHEFALLQRTCSEQEQAISELSVKLGEAHLRSDELREQARDGNSELKKKGINASDPLPTRTKSPTPSAGSYSQALPSTGSPASGSGTVNWVDDREAVQCAACTRSFNISRRKHHCRVCGGVFCNDCSDNRIQLASHSKLVRACERCYVEQLKQAHCNAIKAE